MTEVIDDAIASASPASEISLASVSVHRRDESLSLAARLIPSGAQGEAVAGDFFDVFERIDSKVVIALGDVAGHGLSAAARMTTLRFETHELAHSELTPAEVIARLDVSQSTLHPDEIATLWLGLFDDRTGWLQYASAGHPPPVLAGVAGGPQLLAEACAPPLGTGEVAAHATVDEVELPVGAFIVAYTDGLVERPDRDLDIQIEGLRVAVDQVSRSVGAEAPLDRLVELLLDSLIPDPRQARDDICLLMLRRDTTAEP